MRSTLQPPKYVPPTVGGHRLGALFRFQGWTLFWGRPLGGSNRGSVPWSQQLNLQRCVSLTRMALLPTGTPSRCRQSEGKRARQKWKPGTAGGALEGSTYIWKPVYAGGLTVCVWEARQSGRPADKYMVRCLEAGPSRRPKMYIAGKPDKTEYTMILRLHHTWRM